MRSLLALVVSWFAAGLLVQSLAVAMAGREEYILAFVAAGALPPVTWLALLVARGFGKAPPVAALLLALVVAGVALLVAWSGRWPDTREAVLLLAIGGAPALAIAIQSMVIGWRSAVRSTGPKFDAQKS